MAAGTGNREEDPAGRFRYSGTFDSRAPLWSGREEGIRYTRFQKAKLIPNPVNPRTPIEDPITVAATFLENSFLLLLYCSEG